MKVSKNKVLRVECFNRETDDDALIFVEVELLLESFRGDYYTPGYREISINDILSVSTESEELDWNEVDSSYYIKQYNKSTKKFDEITFEQYFDYLESSEFFSEEEFDDENCFVLRY